MSKVNFKIGAKGACKGVTLYIDYDDNNPGMKLSDLKDKALVDKIESITKEGLNEEDYEIEYSQDGAYVELIHEESNTHILVLVGPCDHDGNPLYIKSTYDEDSDMCIIDMNNKEVIKSVLDGLATYNESEEVIEISDDLTTVTIEQNENMWLDTDLLSAIKILGIEGRYSEEFMNKLEDGSYYEVSFVETPFLTVRKNEDTEETEELDYDTVDKEVSALEKEFFKLTTLVDSFKGKKIMLEVDNCGAVFGLKEVEEYDFDSIGYDITSDIALIE